MAEIIDEGQAPWFQKGLRFQCTGCGKCCTGSPGYVFLSPDDIERFSCHLQLPLETFIARYTRRVDDRLALIDAPHSDACIFLKNNQCSAYEARPVQCRTFPWWAQILSSKTAWLEAARGCEGINHPDAPLVPFVQIESQRATYLDNLIEQSFSHFSTP